MNFKSNAFSSHCCSLLIDLGALPFRAATEFVFHWKFVAAREIEKKAIGTTARANGLLLFDGA
jgi:hypothetical protein